MKHTIKNQQAILSKLGISQLNPMQKEALQKIPAKEEVILLSPTGTGKTLAFLLPIVANLDKQLIGVQAMILAPSRELAMQIEQVAREMGSGYKVNVVYGGRPVSKDKIELKHPPTILIGTPGRVADHLRRGTFSAQHIHTLVLDEFDKSLEIGFEDDMAEIVEALPTIQKKVLTSATKKLLMPKFIGLKQPTYINYLPLGVSKLDIKLIISPDKDKLETLGKALCHLGNQPGIVFCNYKDSIQRVSDFLNSKGIQHGCFYGGMEQQERERALIKFRNGTHQLLIATDLAARGIDIQEIKFIIHYHLPHREQEFIHRNGRTARMHQDGKAFVLKWQDETLPEFITTTDIEELLDAPIPTGSAWRTLLLTGGRKDKISKGDIAGLCFKIGLLSKEDLGMIELKHDCAFIAVRASKVPELISLIDNRKLKKRKIRVRVI